MACWVLIKAGHTGLLKWEQGRGWLLRSACGTEERCVTRGEKFHRGGHLRKPWMCVQGFHWPWAGYWGNSQRLRSRWPSVWTVASTQYCISHEHVCLLFWPTAISSLISRIYTHAYVHGPHIFLLIFFSKQSSDLHGIIWVYYVLLTQYLLLKSCSNILKTAGYRYQTESYLLNII